MSAVAKDTIAAVCAWRMLRSAVAAGVDPSLVPPFDPPADDGLESRVPHETFVQLWESLMRSVRDPGLPVRMVQTITSSDFDAIGFACMTRATMREALHQAVRFARIWTDGSEWLLSIDERVATLEFQIAEPHRLGDEDEGAPAGSQRLGLIAGLDEGVRS